METEEPAKALQRIDSADLEEGLDSAHTLLETLEIEGLGPNQLAMRRGLEELGDWVALALVPAGLLAAAWLGFGRQLVVTLPLCGLVAALWSAVVLGVALDEIRAEDAESRGPAAAWMKRLMGATALFLAVSGIFLVVDLGLMLALHLLGVPEDVILSVLAVLAIGVGPSIWLHCLAESVLLERGTGTALFRGLRLGLRSLNPLGTANHRTWKGLLASGLMAVPVLLVAALPAGLSLLLLGAGAWPLTLTLGLAAVLAPTDWLITSWSYRYLAEAGSRETLPAPGETQTSVGSSEP